jgi:hypothetical protein
MRPGSGAFGIFHQFGMDPDLFILADKGGHHDAHAIVQDRGLEAVGGGLAAQATELTKASRRSSYGRGDVGD